MQDRPLAYRRATNGPGTLVAILTGAILLAPGSFRMAALAEETPPNLPAMETMDDAALEKLAVDTDKGPTGAAARYYRALRKRKGGDLPGAIAGFRKVADERRSPVGEGRETPGAPGDADSNATPFAPLSLHQLAAVYRDQKKTAEATMVSQELLKRFPGAIEAPVTLHMLALDANASGDETRAVELLSNLIERYPGFREAPAAVLTLGALHQKRGRCGLARATFGTMEVLLAAEKTAGIARQNERPLRLNARLGLAYAFEYEDKTTEALAAYRSLLADTADPKDKAMHDLVARTLKRLEEAPPRKPEPPATPSKTPGRIEETPKAPVAPEPPKGGRIGN